jgi:hypothetical protein
MKESILFNSCIIFLIYSLEGSPSDAVACPLSVSAYTSKPSHPTTPTRHDSSGVLIPMNGAYYELLHEVVR